MILGFRTHIDGKETHFVDKIWQSFKEDVFTSENWGKHVIGYVKKFKKSPFTLKVNKPKLHTIREDKGNLWKAGKDIHFVIINRTKNRFQFAPVIQVKSVQRITIDYSISESKLPYIAINRTISEWKQLNPNNHIEYITELQELAQNDGFDSWEEFLNYFNKDFKGKIIHWTDLRY